MTKQIQKAQGGDAKAFTDLMNQHMQLMYKTARAILYSDEDVADAVQDTILCCWQNLADLKKPSRFRSWLTRVLINKCNDILRKKQMLVYCSEVPEMAASGHEFENVEWNEALKSLDEKYRLIIMLYYVEGFKTREISQILELPEATVRTRLSRARQKVADIYQLSLQSIL